MNLNNILCNKNAAYFAIQRVSRQPDRSFLYFSYYYYYYHYRSIKSSVIKVRRILLPGYFRDTPYNRGGKPTLSLSLALPSREDSTLHYVPLSHVHFFTETYASEHIKLEIAHSVGNLKLKLVFYMHIKPTIIFSSSHTRILFIRPGWTLLFRLWSAYASLGNLPIFTTNWLTNGKRHDKEVTNASLTRQQDVINDPHEGHLQIRFGSLKKKKERSTCAVWSYVSLLNMPKGIFFRHALISAWIKLIVSALLKNCLKRRLIKRKTD